MSRALKGKPLPKGYRTVTKLEIEMPKGGVAEDLEDDLADDKIDVIDENDNNKNLDKNLDDEIVQIKPDNKKGDTNFQKDLFDD